MEEAEVLCDRVAIMDEGKIVSMDSPKESGYSSFSSEALRRDSEVEQANLEDVFIDLTGKELRGLMPKSLYTITYLCSKLVLGAISATVWRFSSQFFFR